MRAVIQRISYFCARAFARRSRRLGLCAALLALLCAAAALPAAAYAQSDEDFMAAREAFRVGNRAGLAAAAARLGEHPLFVYVLYWQMRQRLDDAPAEDVRALISRLADGPLGERLRNDWLIALGKHDAWAVFAEEHRGLRNEDPEVACYDLRRRILLGEAQALHAARELWLAARSAPDACTPAFEAAIDARVISQADVWSRMRVALEQGRSSVANRVSGYLLSKDGFEPKALNAASGNPRLYLERGGARLKGRGAREIAMFALQRMARSAPQEAVRRWQSIKQSFSAEERDYVWGRLGYLGAMFHDPDALSWFAQANRLDDLQLAWKARSALRAQQWALVAQSIEAMSETARAEPEWRYWKARALLAEGKTAQANALLAPLAAEVDFYGLLAADELGDAMSAPSESYRAQESEIQAFANLAPVGRALALYRLGLRVEGTREWLWAIEGLDDRQLLAGAEYARRNELWDRAINTAERTRSVHDFSLRYLAPYRERFRSYAREHGLDEAWVLGVARQESRFVADARSRSGAMGLMQLMPATARWVAGKLGLKGFRQAAVTDLDINISLGTYYLKYVLDSLDSQPVLASAGYNAGPGRARAWRASEEMESAIYAETIPFNETRDYVKKVMVNAAFYASMLGQQIVSLKERMGSIPARAVDGAR